jgi:hypothetical protein
MKTATVIGDATIIRVEKQAMIRLLRQDPAFSGGSEYLTRGVSILHVLMWS